MALSRVSTVEGDHTGTRGVECFFILFAILCMALTIGGKSELNRSSKLFQFYAYDQVE